MISNPNNPLADACAPDANQAGPALPENIARLIYVLRILLEYGRHLVATMERRAAGPGFWLFRAVFGTAELPVILSHLNRGILRATALESLLLRRAASGRDAAAAALHTGPAPDADANTDPCNEPFNAQIARLTAERARHDAPIDPVNPAAQDQIETEVRTRPIGRTIADIRRDLGIIAMLCTRAFWDTVADAIARYENSEADCPDEAHPELRQSPQSPEEDSIPQRRGTNPSPRQSPASAHSHRHKAPLRANPARARPRYNVTEQNRCAAVPPAATGPPLHAWMKRAA